MQIKKTFERKTKENHYRRYFADDKETIWYVFLNYRNFTRVIKRIYLDLAEERHVEKCVPVAELPQVIFDFIVKDLDGAA